MAHRCTLPNLKESKVGSVSKCTVCNVKYIVKLFCGAKMWGRK